MSEENIYIVLSYVNTWPGRLIKARASLKFWNRHEGDCYSHASISRDKTLNNMVSFARKGIKNPFNAGLVQENIHEKFFNVNPHKNMIAVIKISTSNTYYEIISKKIDRYWKNKTEYNFNFIGLVCMLLFGRGMHVPKHFFCSEWISTILLESGIELFDGNKPCNIAPFTFYEVMMDKIIYEGTVAKFISDYSHESNKVALCKNQV